MKDLAQKIRRWIAGAGVVGVASAFALAPVGAFASSSTLTPTSLDAGTTQVFTLAVTNTHPGNNITKIRVQSTACINLTGASNGTGYTGTPGFSADLTYTKTIMASSTQNFTFTGIASSGACTGTLTVEGEDMNGYVGLGGAKSVTVNAVATPTPTPTPTPTATPTPTPTPIPATTVDPLAPSTALQQFLQIFYTVVIAAAAIIVPLLVITWGVRLTANLIQGK